MSNNANIQEVIPSSSIFTEQKENIGKIKIPVYYVQSKREFYSLLNIIKFKFDNNSNRYNIIFGDGTTITFSKETFESKIAPYIDFINI